LLIGGSGGSGTRVLVDVLQRGGYDCGSWLNKSNDSVYLTNFIRRWAVPYLKAYPNPLSPLARRWMMHDLDVAMRLHAQARPVEQAQWLAKDPRSVLLLPFLAARWPGLRFLHVVRDGRDMAFSANQNQLAAYGAWLLSPAERQTIAPLQAAALWRTANLRALRFAEAHLKERYLYVQFEALCDAPEATIERILRFANGDVHVGAEAAQLVNRPKSVNRYAQQPRQLVAQIEAVAHDALVAFGYLNREAEAVVHE
jgi:hypothetical protein